MQYTATYQSPIGEILLAADENGVIGVWFENEKYFGSGLESEYEEKDTPVLKLAKHWLDIYFSGKNPDFMPPIHMIGTEFQKEVWEILLCIPYGQTITYGEIAKKLAERRKIPRMSAQAVGGAVGHNKLSILIPCHRVVGSNGSLTGYAGGLNKKIKLLELEGVDKTSDFLLFT